MVIKDIHSDTITDNDFIILKLVDSEFSSDFKNEGILHFGTPYQYNEIDKNGDHFQGDPTENKYKPSVSPERVEIYHQGKHEIIKSPVIENISTNSAYFCCVKVMIRRDILDFKGRVNFINDMKKAFFNYQSPKKDIFLVKDACAFTQEIIKKLKKLKYSYIFGDILYSTERKRNMVVEHLAKKINSFPMDVACLVKTNNLQLEREFRYTIYLNKDNYQKSGINLKIGDISSYVEKYESIEECVASVALAIIQKRININNGI